MCSRLAYIKKNFAAIRQKAKVVGLGTQFGMGANSLFKQNEDFFSSKAEAQTIITMLDHLFPKVTKYKQDIVRLAHKQKYLHSPFGYIRWFWQVLKYDPLRQCLVHGEQAEQAIAFLPANIAFGHKKEAMLTLSALGLDEKYGLINEIHDALLFCCPEGLVPECCQTVQEIMEAPSKVLIDPEVAPGGLSVKVDVMVGNNWAGMEEDVTRYQWYISQED
jgi:DNA polymerase I-like protein with 3'-5' exonuclease and polymerase domains